MPILGLSKLDAVNEMLEAIDEEPVAALDTGGSSIQAKAERILDREDRRVQSQGWPENTDFSKKHTTNGSGLLTVPSDTLWVRAAGPDGYRHLVLNGDTVYDADRHTTNLGATTDVYLDIVRKLTFENCSPKLKDLIVKQAALIFQRRQKGELADDAFLQQEMTVTNLSADRLTPVMQPPNLHPAVPSTAAPQQSAG